MAFITAEKLKFKTDDLVDSIQLINSLCKLRKEDLLNREMKPGEVQKIYRFLAAVKEKKSTLLPSQALTLMKMTPVLFPLGKNIVHDIVQVAAPTVKSVYEQVTKTMQQPLTEEEYKKCLEGLRSCKDAMETAGHVCMRRGMDSLPSERRKAEFDIFGPFIGETPKFKENLAHFQARRKPRNHLPFGEPVEVLKVTGGYHYPGGINHLTRQYEG